MQDARPQAPEPSSFLSNATQLLQWSRENPAAAALLAAIAVTCGWFLCGLHLFANGGAFSAFGWARTAWNPEGNMEHGKLVPFVALYLFWHHRDDIRNAPKKGSNNGLWFVGAGILLFILSARCLQPRMALCAVPFLLYGSIFFLWGKKVARILFFPCAFLVFMIPIASVQQGTFRLQFIITGIVGTLANLVGLHIQAVGTTLAAQDGSFHFEIAEGCSGIRSLTALTMISAVYAHLTQDALWKKILIVAGSAVFAIIGNVGRIFTVLLVARFFNADLAGGKYHDISGYLIFPFAIFAMLGFSKLLNINYKKLALPENTGHGGSGSGGGRSGGRGPTYDY
jgi:exosortase